MESLTNLYVYAGKRLGLGLILLFTVSSLGFNLGCKLNDDSISGSVGGGSGSSAVALQLKTEKLSFVAGSGGVYTIVPKTGTPPYSYSIISGGGTVDASTGIYTASKNNGTTVVEVKDFNATVKTLTIEEDGFITDSVTDMAVDSLGNKYILTSSLSLYPNLANGLAKVDASYNADPEFDTSQGFNGTLSDLVELPNGDILVLGSFTEYKGEAIAGLARLDAFGNLVSSFSSPGFTNTVKKMIVFGDSVYVVGNFTAYGGQSVERMAKIDLTTGALDTTFTQATGFNSWVNEVKVFNGALYVGGLFSTYRGVPAGRLAKLDPVTGALDTTFTQATGFDSTVYTIDFSGSDIYVGGNFNNYNGSTAPKLAKLNATTGALDTTFTQATGPNLSVGNLIVHSGSVYITGSFGTYRGSPAKKLAKIDSVNGSLDTTFTQATGLSNNLGNMKIQDGFLYGQSYSGFTYRSVFYNGDIYRFNLTSGNVDAALANDFYVRGGNAQIAKSIKSNFSNTRYILGRFTTFGKYDPKPLVKIKPNGDLDKSFTDSISINGSLRKIVIDSSDNLYIGGSFSNYNGTTVENLIKINSVTGALDTTFTQTTGVKTGFSGGIDKMSIHLGSLFVAGDIDTYRGVASRGLIKIDPSTGNRDAAFFAGTFSYRAYSYDFDATHMYVGTSEFASYDGNACRAVCKIQISDGAFVPLLLGAGFTRSTWAQALNIIVDGNDLYVGGTQDSYNGVALDSMSLSRVDKSTGVLDTTFDTQLGIFGSSLKPTVYSMVLFDSSLYVSGGFSSHRGVQVSDFQKLSLVDGSRDASFTVGNYNLAPNTYVYFSRFYY